MGGAEWLSVMGDRGVGAERSESSGLALAVTGFALLSCGDAVIKTMGDEWAGTAVAALRFSLGAVLLGALVARQQGKAGFSAPRPWLQAARGCMLAFASLLFFLSIFVMPLAEATAISFATPAIVALLSALLLRERIPAISWLALLLASAGVAIVLRPNFLDLGPAALMPLIAAFAMAGFFLVNHATAQDVSPVAAQFWAAAWAAPFQIVAMAIGIASGIDSLAVTMPDWTVVARCALVAVTASTAHYLIFLGTMRASAATIAPASYVQIIVALLIGMTVFGDFPDAIAIGGTLLIIVAGLMLWRAQFPMPLRRRG